MRNIWLVLLSAAFVTSCGSSIDRDIEGRATIAQGVYGQTTTYDDVPPVSFDYVSQTLQVFDGRRAEGASPAAETTSDERGFYEFHLAPGDYEVCLIGPPECLAFTIAEGVRIRRDYEAGERRWQEGPISN